MGKRRNDPEIARQSLELICQHFELTIMNGQGSQTFHQIIADKLSALAGKSPPWSHRYIVSVRTGSAQPSLAMIHAIRALGYMLDDGHPLIATSTAVDVLAHGQVAPGSVILGDSRHCEYPGCGVVFVPRVPWQRFCSPECRVKRRNP